MGTKKSMIKHLKTNYITSSKKLHLNPARDISLVLSIRIRVFVPDLPYTAAWNDHTVPRAKGSILPHNILPRHHGGTVCGSHLDLVHPAQP